MFRLRSGNFVVVLLLATAGTWLFLGRQERPLGPTDGLDLPAVDTGRVAVGDVAPDFTLLSRDEREVTLSVFRAAKNVVLVFYRGHWCPYCAGQLAELGRLLSDRQKRSTEIVAVSVDPKEMLDAMVERISSENGVVPDYLLLSDPGHRVIDRYGILNTDSDRGIPHPTTFVIDREGIVRWKFIETDFRIRPSNEMILEALAELEGG
jgi:peroxiredoxin